MTTKSGQIMLQSRFFIYQKGPTTGVPLIFFNEPWFTVIPSCVGSNVHAHDDTLVSIYTGGFCVIAHKEKYFRTALLDSRKNTSGGFFKTRVHFEIAFYWKTVSCSGGITILTLFKKAVLESTCK